MNCCVDCFIDRELKNIIIGKNRDGFCDFCGDNKNNICNVSDLSNIFAPLIRIYEIVPLNYPDFPEDKKINLVDELKNYWRVFSPDCDYVEELVVEICSEQIDNVEILFQSYVYNPDEFDKNFLKNNLIFPNGWNKFIQDIKSENRYFPIEKINLHILDKYLDAISFNYLVENQVIPPTNDVDFYRARISKNGFTIPTDDMGVPPMVNNLAGRANPEGIKVLYLSTGPHIAIQEIRPGVFDKITVGEFRALENLKIVSFINLDKLSPFLFFDSIREFAVNLRQLKKINNEISRPQTNYHYSLDYIPIQYLSGYIKSLGYDGIHFKGTLTNRGANYAFFYPSKFDCHKSSLHEIKATNFALEPEII